MSCSLPSRSSCPAATARRQAGVQACEGKEGGGREVAGMGGKVQAPQGPHVLQQQQMSSKGKRFGLEARAGGRCEEGREGV